MGELWCVRHGETEWSRSGRHTGRSDIPLSARGEEQARLVAKRLAGKSFALVLTSPLTRAKETCRLAALAAAARVDDDLAEWNYGVFEGRTSVEIEREIPDWSVWTTPIRGGESVSDVGARADRVIARALAVDGDVALFAHGHLLRILAARWLGLDAAQGRLLALDTASISRLGFEHGRRVIRVWNESCA
jgi:probable phosphoglycerate mutase